MSEEPLDPPPRAFTQGVGTVFQFTGVTLFIAMMFICCGSALISKDKAESKDFTSIGWHLPSDPPDQPTFSAQRAIAIAVPVGVLLGLALATLGLGLQAENRIAPFGAVLTTSIGLAFWITQTIFAAIVMKSILLTLYGVILTITFAVLFPLAIAALREMFRNPPADGHELLPVDYQIPYSHLHQDPPEIRLAKELHERRQKLAIEQAELDQLERRIKHYAPDKPKDVP
jgi:hypothetical protein